MNAADMHEPKGGSDLDRASESAHAADKRRSARTMAAMSRASLLVCVGLAAFLAWFYVDLIWPYLRVPADVLMWAETDFVGTVIKLRTGIPIYTPPQDSNSLIYAPLASVLTYAVSWLVGESKSIPAWRVIQLGYVVAASVLAVACARKLHRLAFPSRPQAMGAGWMLLGVLVCFLAATSPETGRFVHCLHADALSLLVSMVSLWSMLHYLASPSPARAALMGLCPALGFLTKQLLVAWGPAMFLFLLLHDRKNIRALATFAVVASAALAGVIGACYAMWGDAFLFWTFRVMGGKRSQIGFSYEDLNVSLPRAATHLMLAWSELAIGLFGGWLLCRGANARRFGPLWASWFVLVAAQTYLSGAGWHVLYQFGPSVMIGTVFLLAALAASWPPAPDITGGVSVLAHAGRCASGVVAVCTVFLALHVVPNWKEDSPRFWPGRAPSPDVARYIHDIEREFEGLAPDKILLDIGNWPYLKHGVLVKDRAVSLGDQPLAGIYENFDRMVERLDARYYDKLIVRDYDDPFFVYDVAIWERSSGVRAAIERNYDLLRRIKAADGENGLAPHIWHVGRAWVFVPKRAAVPSAAGK